MSAKKQRGKKPGARSGLSSAAMEVGGAARKVRADAAAMPLSAASGRARGCYRLLARRDFAANGGRPTRLSPKLRSVTLHIQGFGLTGSSDTSLTRPMTRPSANATPSVLALHSGKVRRHVIQARMWSWITRVRPQRKGCPKPP